MHFYEANAAQACTSVELYFTRSTILWAFRRMNRDSSFRKAVSFSSAHTQCNACSHRCDYGLSLFPQLVGYKPPFPIPKTQSAFHRLAQRTGFGRRDLRVQSRFVRPLESIARRSPNSNRL
jgi:hypothetical protein